MNQQGLLRHKRPFIADNDIMELQWQNGRVVTQNQSQSRRYLNNPSPGRNSDYSTHRRTSLPRENQYLFNMQQGEMAPMLHYANGTMQAPQMRSERSEQAPPNFAFFARHGVRAEPEPLPATESIVDSSDTPAAVSETSEGESCLTATSTMFDKMDGWSSDEESDRKEMEEYIKRRRDQLNEHDQIQEKMKALQKLIPGSNMSDEESMLDEVIEYMKSLQLQVQMIYMGYGTVPTMFPEIQQYMAPIGMGINMPEMSFPNMFHGYALPTNFGSMSTMPPFHIPHVPTPDSFIMPAANLADNNMLTSVGTYNSNQLGIPNFTNPYQQYLGPYQMQFQLMQNQAMNQTNVNM